jgi:hypothetical protein
MAIVIPAIFSIMDRFNIIVESYRGIKTELMIKPHPGQFSEFFFDWLGAARNTGA